MEQLTHQIVRVDVQDDCSDKLNNNNKATEKQDNKTALEAIRNEIMFLKSKIESLHSETSKQFEQIKSSKSKGLDAGDSPQLPSEPAPAPHNARSVPMAAECDLVTDKTSELQSLDDVTEYEDDYEEDADYYDDDDQLTLHSSPGAPDSGYSAGTSSLTLTSLASSVSPPRPSCRRGPALSRRSASVIGTVHLWHHTHINTKFGILTISFMISRY